jgi:glycosyltransferase involved in cell wall biosynthesis
MHSNQRLSGCPIARSISMRDLGNPSNTKASPQLSVIIPTYNRAALLRRTLDSVLRQTFTDYEIIVVDDGSTDSTKAQVDQISAERSSSEQPIRYFFQKNQGKSVALNHGLSQATGEWIAFLDDDDIWLPAKIDEQFRALRRFAPQSEACFTNAQFINNPSLKRTSFEQAGKCYPGSAGIIPDSADLVTQFWIYMQTIIVHSWVMNKVGEFDPALWTWQDADFVFRLSLETQLCYVNSPLVLIDRTPHRSVGLTERRLRMVQESSALRQQMLENWFRRVKQRGATGLLTRIRSDIRCTHSKEANEFLIARKYPEARRSAALAARAQLTCGVAAKWVLAAVAPALARRLVIWRSQRAQKSLAPNSKVQSHVAAVRDCI